MNRNALIATVAGFVSLAATITICAVTVMHNQTERELACIESGGSYVLTESGEGRECRQ